MIGQPLPQMETIQNWNDFVNEMRFWMTEINQTMAQLKASSVTPEYVEQKINERLGGQA